jgi:hypothetical protein
VPVEAAELLLGVTCPVVAEEDVERLTVRPIAAHISATAVIHPILRFLRFDSNRRTRGRRWSLAVATEADPSGGDAGGGGGVAAALELPATGGSDVAPDAGPAGRVSWGLVGS